MICKYSQYRLSSLDGAEPKGRLQSHLRSCSGCREYQEKLSVLGQALSSQASVAPSPVQSARPNRVGLPIKTVLFASTSLVLVAGILLWARGGSEITANQGQQPQISKVTAVVPSLPSNVLEVSEPTLLSKSVALSEIDLIHRVTPLEQELAAWHDDGKRGLQRVLSLGQK